MFALRDGILVGGDLDDLTPVEGPFGQSADYGVTEVALSVDSTKVAGVAVGRDRRCSPRRPTSRTARSERW